MSASSRPGSLLVIGAGIGGYTAAIRAAREGMAVTLVEPGELGGTCLNVGCIPTKSLLHQAHQFRQRDQWEPHGLDPAGLRLNYAHVIAQRQQVVQQLVQGVRSLVRRNRITLVQGHAEFSAADVVCVRETGAELRADRIVIATGSEPVMPALPGLDLPGVVDSTGALALTERPSRVMVIGGGVVGVEFAQIFSDFGSQVSLIEQQDALLRQEDPDIVDVLRQSLQQGGVELHLSAQVREVHREQDGLRVAFTHGGSEHQRVVDCMLVAVGRRPRVQGLGLERIGLRLEHGAILTDDVGRSSIPHIYAVGDVRGGLLLAHKAGAEAECAVAHMLGRPASFSALVMPRAVYTEPEIAAVGLTEAEARQRHAQIKVGRFPFAANGKALSMGAGQGMVKVLADAATDQIVGISMVGTDVTQLLGEATLAVQMELTLQALMHTVHAHPTLTEALMEAAHDACDGAAIHLPPARA
jgi:dihydrolipoamide dehydrogenase